MFPKKIGIPFLAGCMFLAACSDDTQPTQALPAKETVRLTDTTSFSNNLTVFNDKAGVLGVFDLPEMLVLSVLDSANVQEVAQRMGKDYDLLQEDIVYTGAEVNGPGGTINHTNKPENFKFETIACIKRIPQKQPKRAKIVILEAGPMLVFNFYGSYQNLFAAYDKIKRYCKENKLVASGPMREFYLTDPQQEKNSDLWLTRILLPVMPLPQD